MTYTSEHFSALRQKATDAFLHPIERSSGLSNLGGTLGPNGTGVAAQPERFCGFCKPSDRAYLVAHE